MSDSTRIWLKNYPQGVAHDIDLGTSECLVDIIGQYMRKFANRPAYQNMGKTLSFAEIDQLSRSFTAFLQAKGLKPGDKIALMMPNILQYPIALFGALRAGLVIVNTNPLYTAREIEHQIKDSGARAIVIAENFAHELEKTLPKLKLDLIVTASIGEMLGLKGYLVNFVVRRIKKMVPKYNLPGAITFKTALSQGKAENATIMKSKLDDTICIQYTGGTTGVAKGAELTNRNLLANMFQVRAWIADAGLRDGQEVMLTPLPLYHIFSFTVNCLCMASFGALSVLVTNPRDIPGLVDTIRKANPTMMTGVNTLFNALLNNTDFAKLSFGGLKVAVGGAMAIQKAVAERWQKVTGINLTEGYGMTEASPVVSVNPLNNSARIGTIGLPMPSTYLRVVSEEGEVLSLNEETGETEAGEIQVQGPQVMKGYYNRPDETAKTITEDGWLCTGDVGILDKDGFVRIVDRKKDMILVSGFNVYPNEVEDVIALHEKVLEVAVVGVVDERAGEAVKAFVVKKDPTLTVDELRKHCEENLTGYKKPKYIEFRDELPKTNVGKILRRALRDEAK